jgi:hypothetical protein
MVSAIHQKPSSFSSKAQAGSSNGSSRRTGMMGRGNLLPALIRGIGEAVKEHEPLAAVGQAEPRVSPQKHSMAPGPGSAVTLLCRAGATFLFSWEPPLSLPRTEAIMSLGSRHTFGRLCVPIPPLPNWFTCSRAGGRWPYPAPRRSTFAGPE